MAETVKFVDNFRSKLIHDKGEKFQLIWDDPVRIGYNGVSAQTLARR